MTRIVKCRLQFSLSGVSTAYRFEVVDCAIHVAYSVNADFTSGITRIVSGIFVSAVLVE